MPDLSKFLNWDNDQADQWLTGQARSAGISFMIGHRGMSVVLYRNNVAQAAQTMVVAPYGQGTTTQEQRSDAGTSGRDELLIVGLSTLDIRRGDEFSHNAPGGVLRNYRVTYVEKSFTGMVQARAEKVQ